MLNVGLLLPFGICRITTMKVVFGNSGMFPLAVLYMHDPKSVAGPLLHRLPFCVASPTSLAHFMKNISTHYR
jgi:hypothetical protein